MHRRRLDLAAATGTAGEDGNPAATVEYINGLVHLHEPGEGRRSSLTFGESSWRAAIAAVRAFAMPEGATPDPGNPRRVVWRGLDSNLSWRVHDFSEQDWALFTARVHGGFLDWERLVG